MGRKVPAVHTGMPDTPVLMLVADISAGEGIKQPTVFGRIHLLPPELCRPARLYPAQQNGLWTLRYRCMWALFWRWCLVWVFPTSYLNVIIIKTPRKNYICHDIKNTSHSVRPRISVLFFRVTSDHYVGARSELLLRFLFETIHFDLRACFGTDRSLGFLCGLGHVERGVWKLSVWLQYCYYKYCPLCANEVKHSERGKWTESVCRLVQQNLEVNVLSWASQSPTWDSRAVACISMVVNTQGTLSAETAAGWIDTLWMSRPVEGVSHLHLVVQVALWNSEAARWEGVEECSEAGSAALASLSGK